MRITVMIYLQAPYMCIDPPGLYGLNARYLVAHYLVAHYLGAQYWKSSNAEFYAN